VPRSVRQCIAPRRALVCVGSLTVEHSRGTRGVLTPHTYGVLYGVLRGNHGQRIRGLPSGRLCTDCAFAAAPASAPTGLYVLGAVNTAGCPALAYYIGSEAACRAAGAALNLAWGSAVNLATVPRWCSATTTNVYFNAHPIGTGFISAQPLCLTSGTLAPTNLGDTNPPTFAPTRGPNFADPTGKSDTHHKPPFPPPAPIPPLYPQAAYMHCIESAGPSRSGAFPLQYGAH
jgi:hypothetical protein